MRCHQRLPVDALMHGEQLHRSRASPRSGLPLEAGITWRGPSDQRLLALTIDDFPHSGLDAPGKGSMALLDLLATLAIPATFFTIGHQVKVHPGMVARAARETHELGNHLWNDQWSLLLGKQQFLRELKRSEQAIKDDLAAAGLPCSLRWFRPAGGWCLPPMLSWARSQGYQTVLGTIWPLDTYGPPEAMQRWLIERLVHPGGILVLHDTPATNPTTRRTLKAVVPTLQSQGYRFVTLSELLT